LNHDAVYLRTNSKMIYLKSLAAGLATAVTTLIVILAYTLSTLKTEHSTGLGAVAGGVSDLSAIAIVLTFIAGFLWQYRRASRKTSSAR
jgi:hypothetical protein